MAARAPGAPRKPDQPPFPRGQLTPTRVIFPFDVRFVAKEAAVVAAQAAAASLVAVYRAHSTLQLADYSENIFSPVDSEDSDLSLIGWHNGEPLHEFPVPEHFPEVNPSAKSAKK